MDEGALIRARTFEGARKATLALVAPLDDAVMEEPLDPIRDAAACAEPPDRPVPGT